MKINYGFFLFFFLNESDAETLLRRLPKRMLIVWWHWLNQSFETHQTYFLAENSVMRGPELSVARRSESCEWKRTFPKHSKDISSGSFVQVKIEQKQPSSSLFAYGSTIRLSLSSLSLEILFRNFTTLDLLYIKIHVNVFHKITDILFYFFTTPVQYSSEKAGKEIKERS